MSAFRAVILADFAVPSGGAQRVALESARALAEAGVPVTYLHGTGAADPLLDHPAIDTVGLGLSDVWDLPRAQGLAAGLWNRPAAARVRAALAALPPGPKVLHLHQWTRALSPAVLPACLGAGLPVVVTLHDYFAACPNGVFYRFDRDEPCDRRPLSAGCLAAPCDPRGRATKAVRVIRTALTRRAFRGPLDFVHVSDRGRRTIEPFLPPGRHHRIDNPVAVEKQAPAAIAAHGPVAYVGRLTREKGADLVAHAARAAGIPSLFVGEGPLAEEIRRIDPDAEVLGWRSPDAVAALLRARARALVAPSRWYETGPLTVYEAMAHGLPVVVSTRAGAAEKVEDGVGGLVVEPTVAALADAFRRLDPAMGRAAYARYWAAPPTPAAHARKLVRLYEGVLA
jgi:glycosyltransferase involved in cell wall biosynthesis